jgi:hypothetical protein
MVCSFLRKVEMDQALGCGEGSDDANARVAECCDDQKESTLIGAPDTGTALLSIDGFGFDVERIIVNNLFSLFGRDLVASHVIAIRIVPLKGNIGIQSLL